jgi:hypothetical protein
MIQSRRAGIVITTLVLAVSSAAWATDPDPAPAPTPAANPAPNPDPAQGPDTTPASSPLQLHIGDATITPVGFMDFTNVFRSAASGAGIGSSFGSIPYNSTATARLTEDRENLQNSRIGFRADAMVHDTHVIGYFEGDFLGTVASNGTNASVSSNSFLFRMRLYWVDLRKNQFEVLAGQSWSLITPGRNGISPLPSDIFYTQDMDTNYNVGLMWGRIPQLRFVYHPTTTVAAAVSFEEPDQYIGGSSGGGAIAYPTSPANIATNYANQLDNGALGSPTTTPELMPDVIAKLAFDPKIGSLSQHIEFVGLERQFKVFNPVTNGNAGQKFSATGAGVAFNMNLALAKQFHFVTNNFYGDGGGRYMFGQAPDLIVRADGSLSPIHDAATVTGFEAPISPNFMLDAYYGDYYIGRNVAIDTAGKLVGYGYTGSANSQNRNIQEGTIGFTETFWKDPKYGALSLIFQYSYLNRDPWYVAANAPKDAHNSTVYFDLRYTLPGTAPSMK